EILLPGMVFIDGGANEGHYTVFASQCVGPEGTVWAFEPSSRELKRLEKNLELNASGNVRVFRVALAESNGEGELRITGYAHEGHNTLGGFAHEVELARTERFSLRRLDDLVAEASLTRVDVIKLDVEGAEQRVLEGSRDVLTRFRPVILFEA